MSNKDMKLQIVETPDYILAVSDEEIKKDDIIFYHHPKQSFDMASIHKVINPNYSLEEPAYRVKFDTGWGVIEGCKKIIAYQPKDTAEGLDLPLLPQIIVEDDIEKLAEEATKKQLIRIFGEESKEDILDDIQKRKHYFKLGFKSATKVYSEDDLKKAIDFGIKYSDKNIQTNILSDMFDFDCSGNLEQVTNNFIQSLKQPKTSPKWFVAEYKTEYTEDGLDYQSDELKTTTINGKAYLVGKYLNE